MSYAAQHARALARVKAASPTPITVTKGAVSVVMYVTPDKPDVNAYAALTLIKTENVTLIGVPATYGQTPPQGGTFQWAGKGWNLNAPNPYGPDGVTVYCHMIASR